MREYELKQIWNKAGSTELPQIDFTNVSKNLKTWQNQLRKRIKIDIAINSICYILLSPIFYFFPQTLYLVPLLIMVWAWFLWEKAKMYKPENISGEVQNTKDYLENKESLLRTFILRTRLILYVGCPFLGLAGLYSLKLLDDYSGKFGSLIVILFICEISIVAICEIYLRMIYYPSVKYLNDLVKQLETKE